MIIPLGGRNVNGFIRAVWTLDAKGLFAFFGWPAYLFKGVHSDTYRRAWVGQLAVELLCLQHLFFVWQLLNEIRLHPVLQWNLVSYEPPVASRLIIVLASRSDAINCSYGLNERHCCWSTQASEASILMAQQGIDPWRCLDVRPFFRRLTTV
ncbi:MAG: hypothetical protein EBU26_18880 [Verrucomicrobia bacterium]|nr:hypothetical protein [Verrucomicrobiota bacterium]